MNPQTHYTADPDQECPLCDYIPDVTESRGVALRNPHFDEQGIDEVDPLAYYGIAAR